MKVLLRYTLDTLRRNRRTTLSAMAAVLLASTLLSSLCIYAYTQVRWQADIEEYYGGSWHGYLGGGLDREDLKLVDSTLSIEKTMVLGPYYSAGLPEGAALPYLIVNEADRNYWEEMGERNLLLEGRAPQKPGEIAVSKSLFDKNTGYRLGDTVTLPVGNRTAYGKPDDSGVLQEGEVFEQTGERTFTLVGKLDMTTPTVIPGYYAMGFLDRAAVSDTADLGIYVKMKNIRDTYRELPRIAEELGLEKNEYGVYDNGFGYHGKLLGMNGVFEPGAKAGINVNGLVYGAIVLLAAGAFVIIIHSAFALSAGARIRQLGMFRSVGATPGQIACSILFEGAVISAVPILLSIGLGYLFALGIFRIYTGILGDLVFFPVKVRYTWWLAGTAALLSLITALVSAFLPARRAAKLSPIEAIRGAQTDGGLKKKRRHRFFNRLFGFKGELAASSYAANRRAFRSSVAALSLCLALVAGFFCFLRINDLISEFNRNYGYYNIFARIDTLWQPEEEMLAEALSAPGIMEKAYYSDVRASYWAGPEQQSEEFTQNGGFGSVDYSNSAVIERDGRYRVRTVLFGLDDGTFERYCREAGQEPGGYYDTEEPRALALSWAPRYPDTSSMVKVKEGYPLLDLAQGQKLQLEEKLRDSMDTDHRFEVTVGAVLGQMPELDYMLTDYQLILFFPMETYYGIVEDFLDGDKASGYRVNMLVRTSPENDISVADDMEEYCEANWSTEDVYILSDAKDRLNNEVSGRAMQTVVNCIGALLGLIGVSNALTAVTGSLRQRRREFAMLRSVGMDMEGIRGLLSIEALRMTVTPVLFGIPAALTISFVLVGLTDITLTDFIGRFPLLPVALSSLAIMAAVAFAYWAAARQIRRDTIVEAIRDETV